CFSARAKAFSETEKSEKPGGRASAFWLPVKSTSMPRSSIAIGTAEKEETVSTIKTTSGYLRTTAQISSSGFITPVEVSLWIRVTASKSPVQSLGSSDTPSEKVRSDGRSSASRKPPRFSRKLRRGQG